MCIGKDQTIFEHKIVNIFNTSIRDDSFEYQHHMFWLRNNFQGTIRSYLPTLNISQHFFLYIFEVLSVYF